MFYLPLAVTTWLCLGRIINLAELPRLIVYGLFGSVLATIQDRLVLLYNLWEYTDVGPVDTHAKIALLISFSAAPVFAIRFAQGLSSSPGFPWRRVGKFTVVAMLPELIALVTGHIRYHNWWNVGWSIFAYVPIWGGIWAIHRWLAAPTRRSAQQRRWSGLAYEE